MRSLKTIDAWAVSPEILIPLVQGAAWASGISKASKLWKAKFESQCLAGSHMTSGPASVSVAVENGSLYFQVSLEIPPLPNEVSFLICPMIHVLCQTIPTQAFRAGLLSGHALVSVNFLIISTEMNLIVTQVQR